MRVGPVDLQMAALQRMLFATAPSASASTSIFANAVADVAPPAPPPALPTPAATSVQMLIAIAAATPTDNRRRLLIDADRGLAVLERFHAQQRLGRPGVEQIGEIAVWARSHGVPDDPEAAKLLREIELRVFVELAKFQRAG